MEKVAVLDSLPGTGKTTLMFNYMRDNPENKYVYCSPYLAEVGDGKSPGRVQNNLPRLNFKSPSVSPNKTKSLQRCLEKGENVAISHSLLVSLPDTVCEYLTKYKYTLVLDETIQPIEPYQDLSASDIDILIDSGRVTVENSTLKWVAEYTDYIGRDISIKNLCDSGSMVYHNSSFLKVLSSKVFESFYKVHILTFMFEGSIMCSWLKLKGIEYHVKSLGDGSEIYRLKDNLQFLKPSKLISDLHTSEGKYNQGAFSVTWYNTNTDKLDAIRKSLSSVAKKLPKSDKIFWTTFKKYEEALRGPRYTRPRRTSKRILISPFVPKNMRASNDYKDYNTCFYCCNIYPHTIVYDYLSSNSVEINKDIFALSELIQFVSRGSVRVNKPMKLLILSNRMRQLLLKYLQGG